jgi:hypothetical protein
MLSSGARFPRTTLEEDSPPKCLKFGVRELAGVSVIAVLNALRDLPVPSMIALSNSWLPGIRFQRIDYSIIIAFVPELEDRRC